MLESAGHDIFKLYVNISLQIVNYYYMLQIDSIKNSFLEHYLFQGGVPLKHRGACNLSNFVHCLVIYKL